MYHRVGIAISLVVLAIAGLSVLARISAANEAAPASIRPPWALLVLDKPQRAAEMNTRTVLAVSPEGVAHLVDVEWTGARQEGNMILRQKMDLRAAKAESER